MENTDHIKKKINNLKVFYKQISSLKYLISTMTWPIPELHYKKHGKNADMPRNIFVKKQNNSTYR